ncbi:MAG: glycosyltransferase [Prevotella sp.]|nr:glycosyltransferase [Prevotella sp.]
MKQFSILIPSWNNLGFLKLCVESIRRHSACDHQIIIHVNEGTDGTLQWVQDEGLDFTYTKQNAGVCMSMNMMRTKVKTDYICFLNDDMYVLPGWDTALWTEIERLPDNRFFLSATTIQPHTSGPSLIVADYGDQLANFQEQQLLDDYQKFSINDWMGATMPPNVVHRDIWDLVGGYSVELTPGMYSDPDFTAKLWLCGVRYMKGLSASRVYHFESKSTGKVKKNCGQMQFLMKWGLTSSTFRKLYTYRGRDFAPELTTGPDRNANLRWQIMRGRLKALWYIVRGTFRPIL